VPASSQLRPLKFLAGEFAIHRLSALETVPQHACADDFSCLIKTPEEITLICPARIKIAAEKSSGGWNILQVVGPLDFALTGILAGISGKLAGAGISIFAISSWETDYILIQERQRELAQNVLEQCGYVFVSGSLKM